MKKPHIQKYTEDSYQWINEALRKNEGTLPNSFIQKACQNLRDELHTLPNYQDIVYRGVKIEPHDLAKYENAYKNDSVV
ncbi:MAG: ADP-ribosyltransferase, partial [Bacteroidia bacterium]